MADEISSKLKEYKKITEEFKKLQAALNARGANTSGRVKTSVKDIEDSKRLKRIEDSKKKALSDYQDLRWYDSDDEEKRKDEEWEKMTAEERAKEGAFMKTLNFINKPVQGMVGAVEAVTGKGTKKGFFENIASNMEERETFGDLLRKSDNKTLQNKYVSGGLGFALDVALDPVNWVTAGTTALVPAVGTGLVKGGVKGASLGAKANLLGKVARTAKGAEKLSALPKGASENLLSKAGKLSEEYNKTIGKDVIAELGNPGLVSGAANTLFKKFASLFPEDMRKQWYYNAVKPIQESIELEGRQVVNNMDDYYRVRGITPGSFAKAAGESEEVIKGMKSGIVNESRQVIDDLDNIKQGSFAKPAKGTVDDIADQARMDAYARNLKRAELDVLQDKIGIKWADAIVDWGKKTKMPLAKTKTVDEFFDLYRGATSLFKMLKVPLSAGASVNAMVGNAIMTKMMGLSYNADLRSAIYNAHRMVRGGKVSPEFYKKLLIGGDDASKDLVAWMQQNPKTFVKAFGVNPTIFKDKQKIATLLNNLPTDAKGREVKVQIMRILDDADNEIRNAMRPGSAGRMMEDSVGAGSNFDGVPPGYFTSTYSADAFAGARRANAKIDAKLDILADSGKIGAGAAKTLKALKKESMDWYESIDQSHKIGLFVHLASNGIDEGQLVKLKKFIDLSGPGDVVKVKGRDLYKLSPQKAVEASQEAYMNYGAMPAVVKLMRGMPVFGQPFASFSYAMATKIGKTAANNTAFFSKMNSLMREIEGGKSPREREALNSRMGSYLNDPGMMKLPGRAGSDPLYLRVEQMLPYLSLSMFSEGKRDLEALGMTKTAIDTADKLFFGTPEGQVFWTYYILPMMLEEGVNNQFGQPIAPKDATPGEKYGWRPAREIFEGYTSNNLLGGGAALAKNLIAGSEGTSLSDEYVPLGYTYRKMARALRGETTVGKVGTEDAMSRTLRALGGLLGINVYKQYIFDKDMGDPEATKEEIKKEKAEKEKDLK